jgi:hypothetical protein
VELHELVYHAVLTKQFREREHQVGGGRAGRQLAVEPHAHHDRGQHGDRLAEHRGFRFDAAHAPAQDSEPADHRRVRIGADERVGEGDRLPVPLGGHHDARQELKVDLVHDPGARGDDLGAAERPLRPPEERVTLAVAVVLHLDVALQRAGGSEEVDQHRVVDHEVGRDDRVHARRVAFEPRDGGAHRGEVGDARDAGEILKDDPRREERELDRLGARPRGQRVQVALLRPLAELAHRVLEEDPHDVRQRGDARRVHYPVEAPVSHRSAGSLERVVGRSFPAHRIPFLRVLLILVARRILHLRAPTPKGIPGVPGEIFRRLICDCAFRS